MESFADKNLDISRKWVKAWDEAKTFNAKISSKPKYFITFPFPYVNGAPHIGHAYTSFRVDIAARYKRLKGFNVLFPQGFHATGEPILGVVERLKKNDEGQKETLKAFGASDSDIERFSNDPKFIVDFWREKWIGALKDSGFSIDWSRIFTTTDLTPSFSRFIEWQYRKLYEKKYITKGTHPVIWCPHDKSPTGDHDRLVGEGESPQEYKVLLFPVKGEDYHLACATMRPETVFAATNIWISESDYAIAEVDGKKWVISEEAVKKLEDQLHKVNVISKIPFSVLIGKKALNNAYTEPKEIPVFASSFVDTENATGIVMSVPGHAPYDYIALKETAENNPEGVEALKKAFNIIRIEGVPSGELNAEHYSRLHNVSGIDDYDNLEKATNDVYKLEFHKGKFIIPELQGLDSQKAKEKAHSIFKNKGLASNIYETTGKVVCRCTTKCHVKILENQWFIDYNNPEWKKKSKKLLSKMSVYPEEARAQFENTIDWLELKACARKSGLGTKLPFDSEWIVETLSDSTVYMAYYTISNYVNEGKISSEELNDEVFDCVFGNKRMRQKHPKQQVIDEMKKSFEYFYPVDMRNSGKDLIQNHLTFFIMQHIALFEEKHWPKAVSVNGFVNVEGEKMSKSRGNIIPLRNLIGSYGPDFVRINIACSSEGLDDANWTESNISAYKSRINLVYSVVKELHEYQEQIENIDSSEIRYSELDYSGKIFLNSIEKNVSKAIGAYEQMKFRTASLHSFFELTNALKNYLKGKKDYSVLKYFSERFITINAPLLPFSCEEMAGLLGMGSINSLVLNDAKREFLSQKSEHAELLYETVKNDIQNVIKLVGRKGMKARQITVYPAEEWLYELLKNISRPLNDLMKAKGIKEHGNDAVKAYGKLKNTEYSLSRSEELEALREHVDVLENDFNVVIILKKERDENFKSGLPGKPGLYVQ